MNKQELIKKIKEMPVFATTISKISLVRKCEVLKLIAQLNQVERLDVPQKVTVPQFVADWYEKYKNDFEFAVFNYLYMFDKQDESDFKRWFRDSRTKPFQILVSMLQFGYEVEKEKRYEVKLKNTDDYIVKTNNHDYRFYNNIYTQNRKHTRKELEDAGFGWVFDCEGIEVKEVE